MGAEASQLIRTNGSSIRRASTGQRWWSTHLGHPAPGRRGRAQLARGGQHQRRAGFFNRIIDMLRLAVFLVGLGWIIYNVVAWRTAEYGHQPACVRPRGPAASARIETLLTSLSDIQTSQGVLGRALGTGTFGSSPPLDTGTDTFTAVRDAGLQAQHRRAEGHGLRADGSRSARPRRARRRCRC